VWYLFEVARLIWASLAAVLTQGCGSKSGLALDDRSGWSAAPDASVDADPCRWEVGGDDLELVRPPLRFDHVIGLIHPQRDELVATVEMDGDRYGAIAKLEGSARPPLRLILDDSVLGYAADSEHYLTASDTCWGEWRDERFEVVEIFLYPGPYSGCTPSPSTIAGALDVMVNGEPPRFLRLRAATPNGPPETLFEGWDRLVVTAQVVDVPPNRYLVTHELEGRWRHLNVHREDPAGTIESMGPLEQRETGPFVAIPNPATGGLFILRVDSEGSGEIGRVAPSPLAFEHLHDLDELPAPLASSSLAWSGSEVLFMLTDGSLAHMPFGGATVSVEPDILPPGFRDAEVVLRHGSTFGVS
jgi:hypothetical protein